jgi:hypothetical protein
METTAEQECREDFRSSRLNWNFGTEKDENYRKR